MTGLGAGLDKHFADRAWANAPEVADPDDLTEREYLRLFAARPGMYIGYTTLHGVTSYLNGYDQAARRHGGSGLDGFREWLIANHVGEESCVSWWGLIQWIALPDRDAVGPFTPEEELRVLDVLFDLLDKFLAQRESVI
ncbi:hypothetical protein [Nocardia sp. CA-135398]|uniref:hypothetical protein n=1 Tax=Nocardia sp. CA-135398 TaxID=3239977 RepID=UPI003D9773A7